MYLRRQVISIILVLSICAVSISLYGAKPASNGPVPDCTPVNQLCSCQGYTTTLFAGQTIDAGTVNVTNTLEELIITIEADDPWLIKETHIYAGKRLIANKGGNFPPGRFPYNGIHSPPLASYTEHIPLSDLGVSGPGDVIVIAVHTALVQQGDLCEVIESETAWAYGPMEHTGSQWGWSFCFELLGATEIELIGVPAGTTAECGALPEPPTVTGKALCGGVIVDVPVVFDETYSCGKFTRTWTARCGVSVSEQQIIQVADTTAPVLTIPADITIECDEEIPVPDDCITNPLMATAVDECDPDPVVSYTDSITPGSCPQEKTITRKWTAKDACGNSSSEDQIITVIDTIAPVLSEHPSDATVECDAVPAAPKVTATDNCDTDVPVLFDEKSTGACPEIITRTWTATDDCGNSVSHTQTLTVVDTTAPVL
ncbi:MAG: HYR-like domain-containing protein, partial [Planctomycetota bacterium]